MEKRLLTVKDAACLLGTTTMVVLMLLRLEKIVGMEKEGEWLVEADSLSAIKSAGAGTVTCATSCRGGCCGR